MIFALGFDFGLNESVLFIVRIIASVGGAVVGWFVCDPVTRGLYRISFRGATPGTLLLGTKFSGAAALSLLIYFFMPLGGGGSGLGFGPGMGGSPGKGAGAGGDKGVAASKDGKPGKANAETKIEPTPKAKPQIETVEIEIIGKKRFVEDGKDRFYLLRRAEPAKSIEDLDAYFKEHQGKIKVVAVLTKDSGSEIELANGPYDRLHKAAERYKIKMDLSLED